MPIKKLKIIGVTTILVSFSLLSLSAFSLSEPDKEAIAKRIAPEGQVSVVEAPKSEITSATTTKPSATTLVAAPPDGKTVYEQHCQMCHATGAANSPKFGNQNDWKKRIAQGENTLVEHALHGYKNMPPKGGCPECSNESVAAAVKYMTEHSK